MDMFVPTKYSRLYKLEKVSAQWNKKNSVQTELNELCGKTCLK